jgi:hypothetical protein
MKAGGKGKGKDLLLQPLFIKNEKYTDPGAHVFSGNGGCAAI